MMSTTENTPNPADFACGVPGPPNAASATGDPGKATDLGVLETLAELPVSEHLAIYEELHGRLTADLGSTSQEQW